MINRLLSPKTKKTTIVMDILIRLKHRKSKDMIKNPEMNLFLNTKTHLSLQKNKTSRKDNHALIKVNRKRALINF